MIQILCGCFLCGLLPSLLKSGYYPLCYGILDNFLSITKNSYSSRPLTRHHSYIFLIRVCDDHSATWHFYCNCVYFVCRIIFVFLTVCERKQYCLSAYPVHVFKYSIYFSAWRIDIHTGIKMPQVRKMMSAFAVLWYFVFCDIVSKQYCALHWHIYCTMIMTLSLIYNTAV